MNAHDDLRRQLLDSVATRAPRTSEVRARRRMAWRLRGGRRGLLVLVLGLAVGGGVAGAATQLLRQPGDGDRARRLVRLAFAETNTRRACQSAPAAFVDAAPAPEVTATLAPGEPAGSALRTLLRRYTWVSGEILSRTVRLARFPDGEQVLVFVSQGAGFFTQLDPDACDRARRSRLARLHPEHDAVREIATRMLAQRLIRAPSEQMLWFGVVFAAHNRVGVFHGEPIKPGHALDTRLSGARESRDATVYAAIAVRGATLVRIASSRTPARHPIKRSVAVRDGLVAFTLGPGTGPVEVRELAADGRVLAVQRVRG
ncbi:MAG TPA: hypothetical protein VHZ31_06295 [Solirubrobacteraceae bacterium]|jgi:hypothetical protein|nr:hypothetical protein [Solirubrobacteraceae bacterium]